MFSDLVAAYLFLGGMGGGACLVIGVLGGIAEADDIRHSLRQRFRDERGRLYGGFFGSSSAAALCALAVGALCLTADVGRPDRIILLMTSQPSTYLVVGAWALLACGCLALWALLIWCGLMRISFVVFRALHALLALAGCVTMLYTGLLLSNMPSVPLWNSPWLVAVFVLSGASCGLALVLLVALATDSLRIFASVAQRLVRIDTLAIALEILAVALWLVGVWLPPAMAGDNATATDVAALTSIGALFAGPWAPWLWFGLVVVGLAIPGFLETASTISARRAASASGFATAVPAVIPSSGLVLAASLCVLVGGACLRYLVVAAAMLPVAVSPL